MKTSDERSRQRVAIVAAHPDDEVLGCGATAARHAMAGDDVSILILAEGVTSRLKTRDAATAAPMVSALATCAREAKDILGAVSVELRNFSDNRMDGVDLLDVVKDVEAFLERVRPTTVYTHFPHDLNVDHRVVSEAVQTACRPIPDSAVERLLFFEVASNTEWRVTSRDGFVPNYFVDVTATLETKLRALAAYRSEVRAWPHPRSLAGVEHLARWRGSTVGCPAAEAFVVGRCIVR